MFTIIVKPISLVCSVHSSLSIAVLLFCRCIVARKLESRAREGSRSVSGAYNYLLA